MTEESTVEDAQQLLERLQARLARGEDAETAIDVYKTINWVIDRLQHVKSEALQLAERDMRQRGIESLRTPAGSAGWTEPRVRQLDEEAWEKAMRRDPFLTELWGEYQRAQAALAEAQEPFLELPESRFYIR